MADFFIRRPIVAMVISIVTVIVGIVSLTRLPIAEYPPVSPTLVQVTANYRGAAAEAVMDSVATPIESQVNGVDKLLYLQSLNANDGKMTLNVTFDVGTDVDIMQVNTQNRVSLATAQLPDAVKREGVTVKRSSPDLLMVIGLSSPKGKWDAVFLGNYANINLVDAIKRIPGVGDVNNFTAQDYAMRVWLRPDKLAALGLTPDDVSTAIREQNAQSPAGVIGAEPAPAGQEYQYNVRTLGLLREAQEFEEIIVRSSGEGSQVKIKDVARVELGAQTYALRARLNQAQAAVLGVYLAPGANALATADAIERLLEERKAQFPPDMDYEITLDATLPIKASLKEIVHTLFEAIVLVLIVVFLFLQSFRATLIPMLTVPVSLLGVFIAFPLLGFSVNTLTMFGLVLAIGMVVDDAIVVVEAVQHHLEHGLSAVEATRKAMQEVSGPVVAIALILCAVFVPVAFMGGVTGRLYQQFAITIAVSVVFSAINALTLSPALSAILLRKPEPGRGPLGRFFLWFNRTFDRATQGYSNVVTFLVRKAARSMLLLVAAIAGIWLFSKAVPGGFIPDEDKGYLFLAIELPEGASLQRSDDVLKQVEAVVAATPGVRSACALAGFNLLNSLNVPNAALMFVGLTDWEERKAPELKAAAIAQQWNRKFFGFPQARIFAFGPPALPGYGNVSGFSLQFQDRSGGTIQQLSDGVQQFMAAASKRPEIGRLSTTLHPVTPQVRVELDREKTRTLGVKVDSVFQTLQAYLSGAYVNDFVRFGRVFKVFLQAEPQFTSRPDQIGEFYVRNADNKMVPLNTLVRIDPISGPNFAARFNLYPAAEVTGAPASGYSSAQALKALEEVARDMPSEFGIEWSGLTLQQKKAEGTAGPVFLMAVVFVFLLLAAQYESWSLPFAVLLCTPLVVLGTFLGLALRSFDLNVYAQIGLIMLIGLAAKNAILIVEFAKLRREEGKNVVEAAVEGAKLRLRPILMTSFAFILGCVPLMLASGSGGAARSTMGTGVVFGMAVATTFGVFIIPVCYVFVQSLAERRKKQPTPAAFSTVVAFLVVLAGCAVGPDYKRPEVDAPETFRRAASDTTQPGGTNSLADIGWWELAQDDVLRGYIAEALTNSWDIRIAAARVLQAEAGLRITRSQFLPWLAAGGDIFTTRTSEKGPAGVPPGADTIKEFGDVYIAMSTYELDLWGRIRRATEAARAQLLATESAQLAVRQTLVTDVASAYLQLLQLDQALSISRRTLANRTNSLALTTVREEGGVASLQDVAQARILVATAEAAIVDTLRLIEQTENAFSMLLGRNPGPIPRGKVLSEHPVRTEIPAGLPSALLERRPDLRVAEQQLIAANADIGQAKAAFFPQITLTGNYGFQSVSLGDLFTSPAQTWQFGPTVTFPLFTGGRLRGNLALARANFDEAVARYQQTAQSAFRDVSDSLIAYQRLREYRARLERRAQAHRDATELANFRYEGGVTSYLEVLYNEQELFNAELALSQAQANELLSVVQLYRAVGGGTQSAARAGSTAALQGGKPEIRGAEQ